MARKKSGIMALEQAVLNRCAYSYSYLIGHMGMLSVLEGHHESK